MANKPKPDPNVPIQPDTIPVPGEAGNQAIELLDRHRNVVMLVAAVAVLAICGTLVVRELNRQKRSEAAQAFSTAAGERSIEKLDAVVSDYEGMAAAGNALLTKAEIQLTQEKFEDAKVTLLTFVDKYGKHPRHAQGLYALGNLSQRTGDFAAARDFYDRALEDAPGGDLGPLVLIRMGDLALAEADQLREEGKKDEAEAKLDEARQNYEESITRPEFRSSPFIAMAETRLELAKVGDVPVVPAPPEPEPEPEPAPATPEPKPATPQPTPPASGDAKPAGEPKKAPAAKPAPSQEKPAAQKPAPAPKPAGEAKVTEKPAANGSKPTPKPAPAQPKPAAEKPKPADQPKPEAESSKPAADQPKPAPKPETPAPAPAPGN